MTPEVLMPPASPGATVTTGQLDVSVILPVYRNRATLAELHRRLTNVLEAVGYDYELIFVDDCCPEASSEVLLAMSAGDPRLRVIAFDHNRGQQRAVLAGLAAAMGRRVVIMDADLQDPPEAIPALLAKAAEGYEAVFAGRRGNYESTGRLLTSRLFKRVLHITCGVPPDAGIFMVLSSDAAHRLASLNETRPATVAMVGCAGLKMASIPVVRSARPEGKSAYSSRKRLLAGVGALIRIPLWKRRLRQTVTTKSEGAPTRIAAGALSATRNSDGPVAVIESSDGVISAANNSSGGPA